MSPARDVPVQPVVSWHPDEGSATSRIISVDLQLADPAAGWPYDEEEFLVGCMIDGRPSCTVRALDSAGVVLHRFGGTYGPTYFRAELTDASADPATANLWLTLTTAGGVPFYTAALPLDGSGIQTARRPAPPPRPRSTRPPQAAPVVEDPTAPIFFLSYARPDRSRSVGPPRDPSRAVIRFFDDLNELVHELIGSPAGDSPGFMDRILDGGDRWQSSILRAAGTSQVMVSLMSGPYFRSPWCALEWNVFSRRRVVSRTGLDPHGRTAIVPVLWTPFSEPVPAPIAAVQMFTPTGLPDESAIALYREEGLMGLVQTGQTAAYDAIVWKLAMHIQRIHSNYRVEPLVPDGIEGLPSSF
ncbi:TIR-like protein FxsC [Actinoplanes xinjiangensis]|uniref:TIR-like protein FxsC n=1 Tax=Actinoplanes xinjiangensis TaxID=512350 RepID=UPI003439C78C